MTSLQLMILLFTVHMVTITGEKIGNETVSALPESKNAFRFEDQPNDHQSYGLIRFEDKGNSFQKDTQNSIDYGQRIKFEANAIGNEKRKQKKKRRKPRQRLPNGQNGGSYPAPVYPGHLMYPGPPVFGPGPIYPGLRPFPPSYPGAVYKPRPSAASAALSAVTEALSSIALYDDAQCVPRLLCEAAGGAGAGPGAGAVPGAGLLQSIAGLQPLLTLLSAYNGISSSPLFVFGRAVFLGMTSKANPGTCRYAYPQCPNEPEQLVHYLNNHNGGFFRFFSAPELNQQQGLEQFYNQLSGQNYGFYQPQQNGNPEQQNQNLQYGYSPQQNYQNQHLNGGQVQQFGQYQNQNVPQQVHQNLLQQFGYGLAQTQHYNQNYNQQQDPYGNGYGLYGQRYPYQQNLNHYNFKNKDIQKRILNLGNTEFVNNVVKPKWSFPEDSIPNKRDINDNVRQGKVLKFPQSNVNSITAAEGFIFPGIQSNREYPIGSFESIDSTSYFEQKIADSLKFNNEYNNNVDDFNYNSNDGVRTLYVVRGNRDPSNPEIVHLAPGQTLQY